MSVKKNIYDFSFEELSKMIKPSFRAKQIWRWLYINYANEFDMMKNLPKSLRMELDSVFCIKNLEIRHKQIAPDETKKYLFSTLDGNLFESVLIKMKDKEFHDDGGVKSTEKYTICVSSQVGCKIGCKFCRTGKDSFKRNLSSGEIVEQIVAIKRDNEIPPHKRVNIVYMGMGEPLDNFENVISAIKIIADVNGLSISPRRQTISTSGISPKINELGKLNLGVQLAISLHAVNDEIRSRIMPINRAYNIKSIIDSVKKFPIDSRKRVMFEYLMIRDINDSLKDAKSLLSLLDGIKAKVNVILFNPFLGSEFERPSVERANEFVDYLVSKGLLATIRESKGREIDAACGQLKYKYENVENLH